MLRLFILTFPFLVMAALFYAGYILTGQTVPGVMAIICLLVDVVILFRYNYFLHRSKKEKEQQSAEPSEDE
ncbi:MAG: hypothetical protein UDB11_11280 [Peptococcaceae bacterium]|nr:hypothetical protein [Peptococcaceae bacterium]